MQLSHRFSVCSIFQFLNGAIKRIGSPTPVESIKVFQFLNGAIKRPAPIIVDFNLLFQFLNGAIKSTPTQLLPLVQAHFNSSMVRLKGRWYYLESSFRLISIPQWCD